MPFGMLIFFSKKSLLGPRHTPNTSTLRTFFLQKSTNKKLLTFSEKFYEHFKIILQHLLKLYRTHLYLLKKLPDFDLQDFENFISWKKCTFYEFPKIFEFYLPLNRRVLTKIFQINSKLTFNVFDILNHES